MAVEGRPPTPKSILRGHKAQVHAATFIRNNERLVTGDADGFIIAWDLTIMRPRAVWQAHENAILGIAGWGNDRIITHGRDNKLIVWKLTTDDEARMSTTLPLDPCTEPRPKPWMVHLLEVNTMNFCSFSYCPVSAPVLPGQEEGQSQDTAEEESKPGSELLIAVPNTLASEAIDIFHLPSQTRRHTVKLGDKNGMVMAVELFNQADSLTLVAGYENGLAIVAHRDPVRNDWVPLYQATCHSQPILSLSVSPGQDFFITSSADAVIAKHPLPAVVSQDRTTRRVTETQAPQVSESEESNGPVNAADKAVGKSLLGAALAKEKQNPSSQPKLPHEPHELQTQPLKTVNTKHAGQQSIEIRSDGLVFATAGWDSKVRVYSTKTLKEVAVLKWHQVGCYAVAFTDIAPKTSAPSINDRNLKATPSTTGTEPTETGFLGHGTIKSNVDKSLTVVPKLVELTVRDKRLRQAKTAHWLAAGSKDGKVSLWDVF
ncbi:WD40-repeat-containing domain protein [Sordaria brevicollis]|uniref:ASTRA-associated protein 1 n=1 Tax=Sordaria brevicollis TaxID=83679 RepID=A0AAE0PED1_SORBR|nr:WD40-repeat-containing domain protein [Sordaria brevicollis]